MNKMKKEEINKLERKDSTHKLSCRHAVGRNGKDYWMDCIILEQMPNNRLKVIVFGERYWKGYDEKKQIKYVDSYRVKPNSDFKLKAEICNSSRD